MRKLLLSAAMLFAGTAFAQYPTVQTIFSTLQNGQLTAVHQLVAVDYKVYFIATDTAHGTELFSIRETGTPQLELDLIPGKVSGAFSAQFPTHIDHMGAIGNNVYFMGLKQNAIGTSPALYEYDGTNATIIDTQIYAIERYETYDSTLQIFATRNNTKALYQVDPATKTTTLLINKEIKDWRTYNDKIYYTVANNQDTLRVYDMNTMHDTIMYDNNVAVIANVLFDAGGNLGLVVSSNSQNWGTWIVNNTAIAKYQLPNYMFTVTAPIYNNGEFYYTGRSQVISGTSGIYKYNIASQQSMLLTDSIDGQNYQNINKYLSPVNTYLFNDEILFLGYNSPNGSSQSSLDLCSYSLTSTATNYYSISQPFITPRAFVTLGDVAYFVATPKNKTNDAKQLFRYNPKEVSIKHTTATPLSVVAYPNPTTANTTLELQLNKAKTLSIKLTDVTGRTVHTIPTEQYSTGKHNVTLPMEQLPNGNYFYSVIDNRGVMLISGKLIKN